MSAKPLSRIGDLSPLKKESADKVKAAATEAPVSIPEARATPAPGEHPGVERWPVKTGTDADVAKVGQNTVKGEALGQGIVETTVEEMLTFKRAADMPAVTKAFTKNSFYQDRRAAPTETTIWRLTALITGVKLEQDGDYHLVLQGQNAKTTMIGEIPNPDPAYVGNAAWLAEIKTAREAMDKFLGAPLTAKDFAPEDMGPPTEERPSGKEKDESSFMTPVGKTAIITGVGFFDSSHGQTGVAPTAIELHPIFSLVFE
jgi:hypothetical protein